MDWLLTFVLPFCLVFGACDAAPVAVPPRVLRLGDCASLDAGLFACRRDRIAIDRRVPLDLRDAR